jgi:hypothetical protein
MAYMHGILYVIYYLLTPLWARYEKTKLNKTGHPSKLVLKQQT